MLVNVADIEANGLTPTELHCLYYDVVDTTTWETKRKVRLRDTKVPASDLGNPWVFHNGFGYDVPNLRKFGLDIPNNKVIDTFVCSRLFDYQKFRTHSLKELGEYLKVYKGDYTGGWEEYTPDMGAYCEQDVEVTKAILKMFWSKIISPDWKDSLRVEHEMAVICQDMKDNGFMFNRTEAEGILEEIEDEMAVLEEEFQEAWPPRRVEDRRIQYRKKKDGTLYSGVAKAMAANPDHEVVGSEVIFYKEEPFEPSSPKKRIDVLWDAGWKPYDKTKGHKKWLRENSSWRRVR